MEVHVLTFGKLGVGDIVAYCLSVNRTRWGVVTEIVEAGEAEPTRRFCAVWGDSIPEAREHERNGVDGAWCPYDFPTLAFVERAKKPEAELPADGTGAWRLMC